MSGEGEVPEGWAETTLGQCVDVLDNLRVPVNSDERAGRLGMIPYYGATGQVGWIDKPLFSEELLLLGEDGAPFFDKTKPIAYIISGKSWVNNHAHVLRARPISSNNFIKHSLDATRFESFVNGTTRLKLTQGAMVAIPISLPPLPEQHRIVEQVEALLAQVNKAKDRLDRVKVILKRFRQAVLAAACSGKLTEEWREHTSDASHPAIPAGEPSNDLSNADEHLAADQFPEAWNRCRVDGLVAIQNGRPFPSKEYQDHGVRLLRPGNLHVNGRVEWNEDNTACLPSAWVREAPDFLLGPSELVMNLTAQSLKDEFLGRVCLKTDDRPALLNQRIARFRNLGADDVRPFLFVYFKSRYFRQFVNGLDTGSLIRHMHSKDVARHVVPVPPPPEQVEIVRIVQKMFALADTIEARLASAAAKAEKLPQAIRSKAFKGELVPTEAELARAEGRSFETAEEMLRRVESMTGADGPRRAVTSRKRARS